MKEGGFALIRKTIEEITEMIPVENDVSEYNDVEISGVCIDSRAVQKGNLFIPLQGENVDGHRYVEAALQKGAAAALWKKGVPNPPLHVPILIVDDPLVSIQQLATAYRKQLPVKVVGITGSNGKTTTKDILANLLSIRYKVQKTEGNFNNHLGLPLSILQLETDTTFAVLEMGMSDKGEISLLTKIAQPDAVILTNIGESHLLHLGSRQGIAEAKLEILEGLKEKGLIVYFGDEPLLKNYFTTYEGENEVRTFGNTKENDLYPTKIDTQENGNTFTIPHSSEHFHLPILGEHNVLNTLAAMSVARFFEIPFEMMNDGLANIQLTGMRMELLTGAMGEKIINDAYNASPTSMGAAIRLLESMPADGKKIVVLGDILELGPEEEAYHEKIGMLLHPEKIDLVFTYGRLGKKIADGARSSFPAEQNRIFSFEQKEALVSELKKKITGTEIILIKASRGMKLEEVADALTVK